MVETAEKLEDIDDSQDNMVETAEKLETEQMESNSKLDLLEKELSAIPSLAKLFFDTVKQVQKTADDNSEKLNTKKAVWLCGYHESSADRGTITYSDISGASTDGSTLSTATGKYTASTQGLYTLTFSAQTYSGKNAIYLYKDGEKQANTLFRSLQDVDDYGQHDSSTLIICLEKGQEVHVVHDR